MNQSANETQISLNETQASLLDVKALAKLLHCSPRHIRRLVELGRMPKPVRLGTLVRWPRPAIEAWIGEGCEPVRKANPKSTKVSDVNKSTAT